MWPRIISSDITTVACRCHHYHPCCLGLLLLLLPGSPLLPDVVVTAAPTSGQVALTYLQSKPNYSLFYTAVNTLLSPTNLAYLNGDNGM